MLAAERISDGLAGDGAHGRVRSAGADDVGGAVGAWDGVDASLLGAGNALSDGGGASLGGAGVAARWLAEREKRVCKEATYVDRDQGVVVAGGACLVEVQAAAELRRSQ